MTVYALVLTASIAGALGLLAFAYWWQRREAQAYRWFWVAMVISCAFSLSRLAQMLGTWSDRPWIPARGVVTAALLGAWVTAEFASSYTGQRPTGKRRALLAVPTVVPLFLVLGTDLILTRTPVVRRLWGGEHFVGVEVGPLYFVFTLATISLWTIGWARLLRGRVSKTRGGRYFLFAFGAALFVHLFDVAFTLLHVAAPRLSDYSTTPVAIAFALAEVDRYAALFDALEDKVRDRTRDLAEANLELTRKHAERETLQRRLAEAQRLEALGQLAGGVAHDFNNLLTVVSGCNELIGMATQGNPEIDEAREGIRSASERGAALVRQLLMFARQKPAAPKSVDLADHVRGLKPLLERLVGKTSEVHVEASSRALVLIDPTQFDQIVMNLAVNARAAMPDGGALTIRVERRLGAEPSDTLADQSEAQGTIVVTVNDTGAGIPPEVLQRVFEPFFTTKADHGTGLGLATVLRATQEAGGTVTVTSTVGVGTTFELLLPELAARPASGIG